MKIAIGSDHAGFAYKQRIAAMLRSEGHEVHDFGTYSDDPVDYPQWVAPAAQAVARGECERGIVLGGSGNGEAIVANKIPGVRCALCWNVESARLAREHNDATVISIGQRMVPLEIALEIVRTWLEASFNAGRHLPRIEAIHALESRSSGDSGAPTSFRTHEKTLLVRPEHLNHFGGLFGGYMMKWADEMAFNVASLTFPGGAFVTRRFDSFDFTAPVRKGDIIKVFACVESVKTTSCMVRVWCLNARTDVQVFRTIAVMVNIDASGGKAPIPALR